ncbi:uncharacterized protein METZ01_LOCUS515414, partial [marine metagenome]
AGTVTTHTGAVTISDAPTVAQLVLINAATTGAITLSTANGALTGSAANIVSAFAGTVTEHTGTVTVTNAATVAQFNTINAETTQNVVLSGGVSDTAAAYSATDGTTTAGLTAIAAQDGDVAITVSDAPNVAQLVTINAATTGAIVLSTTNGALTGTAANIVTAFAGTVTEHTGTVTVTDAATVAQFNTINAETTQNVVLSGGVTDAAAAYAATDGTTTAGLTAIAAQD